MIYSYLDFKKLGLDASLIQLLKILGNIKSARMRPANIAKAEELNLPPMIVWQYYPEKNDPMLVINEAIHSYPWKDKWILRT